MRRTKPRAVTYCLGDEEHDAEGRLITAEFATHYGARTHACHVCELAAHAQTGQTDSPPCRQWCACTCPMPGRDSSASTTGSRPGARRRLGPAARVRVRAARGTELCGRLEHCFASSMMWQSRTCQHVIHVTDGRTACLSSHPQHMFAWDCRDVAFAEYLTGLLDRKPVIVAGTRLLQSTTEESVMQRPSYVCQLSRRPRAAVCPLAQTDCSHELATWRSWLSCTVCVSRACSASGPEHSRCVSPYLISSEALCGRQVT